MTPSEAWVKAAAYESYVGRWSRMVAAEFMRWLDLPAGLQWLEVGSGTGALTGVIQSSAKPGSIACLDHSLSFIKLAHQQLAANYVLGSGVELPFVTNRFDAVVSGLVLNFLPDMHLAANEMRRVCRNGGSVAAYVWDYAGEMQMMKIFWETAATLDSSVVERDEMRRFPLCKPEPLCHLFESTGFEHVKVQAIDIPTVFRDFEDYWSPFLEGQGPAPAYVMSLSAERRSHLRDRLVERLPAEPDGSIALIARAWAIRGQK